MTAGERRHHGLVELVSVNVGKPAYLGERRGRMVESGIRKQTVQGRVIEVRAVNLDGDGQADMHNHGGPDKAVYAYPSEYLAPWARELGFDEPLRPSAFGENLSTRGWTEQDVLIGDIWKWGSTTLQVCQPRYPCYKLGMVLGRPGVVKALVANGRTGWYLRVLEPGEAPVEGPIRVIERGQEGVTVADVHQARLPDASPDLLRRALSADALSSGLKQEFARELEALVAS
jgi:MOSC domain-containing protein YiiM